MAENRNCPECGANLLDEIQPPGLCPKCLLRLGLARLSVAQSSGLETGRASSNDPTGPVPPIGPYTPRSVLGEGGMGIVYLAEQREPMRRTVALKLIKPGMDSREVIGRFEAERQALALMNHPNIARVFDAGTSDEGRPYFVMEYVPGDPITVYCDRHRLDTRERVELLAKVCEAVQHAHQKGVIHRDIKPSNVLVAERGDRAVPKVIDFGMAKAVAQPLTEKTAFTKLGQLVGTPAYMSPEQAELTGRNVDTRTDVYALGVMLYELLSGALPFERDELERLGFEELLKTIREREPPPPSRRVSVLGDASEAAATARHRGTDPRSLVRQLRGELDWIVMRAMEKDRTHRYSTASEFAADLRRYLENEPVLANPPTVRYRIQKFVRRNRVAVLAVSAIVVALVAGTVVSTAGLMRALRSEARALDAESTARKEAETAKQVSELMVGLFEQATPWNGGSTITAREILDLSVEKLADDPTLDPLIRGRLMATIGKVYHSVGLHDQAETLLEEALSTQEHLLGPESAEVAESLLQLAMTYRSRHRLDAARPLLERALGIVEKLHGNDYYNYDYSVARVLRPLANVHRDSGRYEQARRYYERTLEIWEENLDPQEAVLGWTLDQFGELLLLVGEYERSRPMLERALAIFEAGHGPDNIYVVAYALTDLGDLFMETGDYEKARDYHERALRIRESLGPDHPHLAWAFNNLARSLARTGDREEARELYERAVTIFDKQASPEVAHPLTNLAALLVETGDHAAALPLYERAVEVWEQWLGPEHPFLARALHGLAVLHAEQGRYDQAQPLFARALEIRRSRLGPNHPHVAESLASMEKYAERRIALRP